MHRLLKCITKIDGTTKDDAEDLDLFVSMYNLIEYSSNCSETTRSLWFYSKDEAINFRSDIENTDGFESFECKNKLSRNIVVLPSLKNATIDVPLKYLSNIGRSL